jgi:hypothetical protein
LLVSYKSSLSLTILSLPPLINRNTAAHPAAAAGTGSLSVGPSRPKPAHSGLKRLTYELLPPHGLALSSR